MRRLLSAALAVFLPLTSYAQVITVLATGAAGSANNNTVTLTIDGSGGATATVFNVCTATGVADPTPTNGASDTITAAGSAYKDASGPRTHLYSILNPTSSASYTIAVSTTTGYPSIAAVVLKGTRTAGTLLDQTTGNSSPSASTILPGSVTPTTTGQVVITGMTNSLAAAASTINGGFTKTEVQNGGTNYHCAIAYLIQTSIAAANPTWTLTAGGDPSASSIATFFRFAVPIIDHFLKNQRNR